MKMAVRKWLFRVLIAVLILLASPFVLILIPAIQDFAVGKATYWLSEQLQTKVEVGKLRIKPLSSISLHELYIEDEAGNSMIFVDKLEAKLQPTKILNKEIVVTKITIDKADFSLNIDENGKSNISLFTKLFKAQKEKKPFGFKIIADEIALQDCRFSLKDKREKNNVQQAFNSSDIELYEINGSFRIEEIYQRFIKADILTLSLKEKSGLCVNNLSFSFEKQDSLLKAKNFTLLLPNSHIAIDTASINLKQYSETNNIGKLYTRLDRMSASITPQDLAPLFKPIEGMRETLSINMSAEGFLDEIALKSISLNYASGIGIYGNLRVKGLPQIDNIHLDANIANMFAYPSQLQDVISCLTRRPFLLPKQVHNLQKVSYKGSIYGHISNLHLNGDISSSIGTLNTDVDLLSQDKFKTININGNIQTLGLNLKKMLGAKSQLGNIVFDAKAKLAFGENLPFIADIDANILQFTLKEYTYNNISLNGEFLNKRFEGNVDIDDRNGELQFHGLVDLNDDLNKIFHFDASIAHLNPHKLSLIEKYPDLSLDLSINADFAGENINNINGSIGISDIKLTRNKGSYFLKNISINSQSERDSLITLIESDIINGYISGKYTFATLPQDVIDVFKESFPILQSQEHKEAKQLQKDIRRSNIGFYFEVDKLQPLCDMLDIDWTTTNTSTLYGFYNGKNSMFNIAVDIPKLTNGKAIFSSSHLNLYKNGESVNFIASTTKQNMGDSIKILLKSDLKQDSVNLFMAWKNFNPQSVYAGEFLSNTKIGRDTADRLTLNLNILPTQIVVDNNLLDIEKSHIFTDFAHFNIDEFVIQGNNQRLAIAGLISSKPEDKLTVSLKKIDIGEILRLFMAEDSSVKFGGIIDGNISAYGIMKEPMLEAHIESENLIFNDSPMGNFSAEASFDRDSSSILFTGKISDKAIDSHAELHGGYYLKADSLYLAGDVKMTRLKFVKRFVNTIFSDVDGYADGWVKVYGNLKERGVIVEADADVKLGKLQVGSLGADFFFADKIRMTPDSILFRNIAISDQYNNMGRVDGYVAHKHFDNINYRIDFSVNNMLVFNQKQTKDASFYGEAFATGTGNISGTQNETNITCLANTNKNTKIYIPLDNKSSATSSEFVHFRTTEDTINQIIATNTPTESSSNININLNIEVTPDAQLQMILNQASGDIIQASGAGMMRIAYNTQNENLQLFGNYAVNEGKYRFTFQQAIEREFSISDGSSLLWSGNPQNPIIDLKAIYQTKASLKGLFDQSVLSQSYSSNNVPVNCVLLLTGNLTRPTIKFDIELPSSDENIRRALANILTTEEMTNRQMIYLLAFGRFYNPNTALTAETNSQMSQTQNDVLALVTSTVGSQLNNMLSQLSDKFTIGINIKLDQDQTRGTQNNEYGVNINYSPNDRIVINSNLGYRNEDNGSINTQQATNSALSQAILDFEIEYKLVQSGKLVAKVYNRTNSIQDFKDAPYTQGVGLVYRENFNSIKDLFRRKKKQKQKEEKSNTADVDTIKSTENITKEQKE